MAKQWYFEECLNSYHTLYVHPDVTITFGRFGTRWNFSDSRQFGKVHGMDDYGTPILHQWWELGFHMTVEKLYYQDKSRVIVDDYGLMLYAKL